MNAFLVRATLLSAFVVGSASLAAACSSSSTTTVDDTTDSGSTTTKKDSGTGTPIDSGSSGGATGACATECATSYCAGKNPTTGDACDTCLNDAFTGACANDEDTACAASADCVALNGCLIQCDPDGGASDASTTDQACKSTDAGACEDCCFGNHTAGVKAIAQALHTCACGK